ncbi:ABC transporter permease [Erythrobacter litoralis]|nr:ABC transporter permease [Erythrobacter litoralis]
MHETARLGLWHAAYVMARRDFRAILFSKAFVLFLLGPLFFIGISLVAGTLGARAAESAAPARLAVALPQAEAAAFERAYAYLDRAVNLPPMRAVPVDSAHDSTRLLADPAANFGAVVTGSLAAPRLIGTEERLESWRGEVALIVAEAQGGGSGAIPDIALEPTKTSVATQRSARVATATGAITLLFLLTMLLAGMVLSNLVEEKANKIIEILAAAIPMDAVFLGKLLAMLALSFVGIAVWGSLVLVGVAVGGAALPALPVPAVGWPLFVLVFVLYFSMAYLLIGSVFLTIGSMAPTVRDVQTISMPATIMQLAVFFLATFAMNSPGSPVELFAAIFPLSSPYAMVARAAQSMAMWPHLAALVWQAIWVALFVRSGATLFRRKVMKSGPSKRATKAA